MFLFGGGVGGGSEFTPFCERFRWLVVSGLGGMR